MTWITSDWDFYELLWPQIFRGIGLMLSIIPINDISLGTLPPERVKNASGLFNLMRNLGGAFGLAGLHDGASTTARTCIWRACTTRSRGRACRPWRR